MNKIQWVDFSPRWLTQLSSWHKDFPDLWEKVSELSPSPVVPDSQPRVRRLFANHKPALMQKNTSYWAAECLHCTRAIEFHLFNYLFIFYKFIIYLKRQSDTEKEALRERQKERERPTDSLPPEWPQWPGLIRAEAWTRNSISHFLMLFLSIHFNLKWQF